MISVAIHVPFRISGTGGGSGTNRRANMVRTVGQGPVHPIPLQFTHDPAVRAEPRLQTGRLWPQVLQFFFFLFAPTVAKL